MRFLHWNGFPGIDIFKDSDFTDFQATLDAEMKHLGLGSKKKQAEPLTELEEEIHFEGNPTRFSVGLYKLYMSLCPSDHPHYASYLQPLRKPTPVLVLYRQPLV